MASENMVIDLRSDTVTKPSLLMRQAIFEAEVGDDVMREDPTVSALEEYAANLFGMQKALFVPTGTMGNLISAMSHCYTRGQEILLGDQCHMHLFEQGGIAQVGGIHHRTLSTKVDGTFDTNEIIRKIRIGNDCHYPTTGLICLENTHNVCGGTVLPMPFMEEIGSLAKTYKLPVHVDGARIMNASTYLGVGPDVILRNCDSISACLSKGLGAPAGAIIAGNEEFIARCVRGRKLLGGGMRQSGILAAAGLFALKTMVVRLREDHENARHLAQAIKNLGSSLADVDLDRVQTNIVNVEFPGSLTPQRISDRLKTVSEAELEHFGEEIFVKVNPGRGPKTLRVVFHVDVNEAQAKKAVEKICYVIREADKTIS